MRRSHTHMVSENILYRDMSVRVPAALSLPVSFSSRSKPMAAIASTSGCSSSTARLPLCASLAATVTIPAPPGPSLNGVLLSLTASLAVLLSAHSEPAIAATATIKMGADEGSLVFVPSSITVPAGEKVVFLNNKGFPHNVIFEKDGVPETVQVEKISHVDYMNEQGEQFVVTLKEKGTYRFFCEPHRTAGEAPHTWLGEVGERGQRSRPQLHLAMHMDGASPAKKLMMS